MTQLNNFYNFKKHKLTVDQNKNQIFPLKLFYILFKYILHIKSEKTSRTRRMKKSLIIIKSIHVLGIEMERIRKVPATSSWNVILPGSLIDLHFPTFLVRFTSWIWTQHAYFDLVKVFGEIAEWHPKNNIDQNSLLTCDIKKKAAWTINSRKRKSIFWVVICKIKAVKNYLF